MVPPQIGGHNLHDNKEAGTATPYGRGKRGSVGRGGPLRCEASPKALALGATTTDDWYRYNGSIPHGLRSHGAPIGSPDPGVGDGCRAVPY
jgi:hypothetical protein